MKQRRRPGERRRVVIIIIPKDQGDVYNPEGNGSTKFR
jgi:predicted nucleotidyltransferase